MPTPNWLSIKTAAEEYGCSQDTVRRAIAKGNLKAYRFNRSRVIRIKRRDLQALWEPVTSLAEMAPIEDHGPVIPQSAATPAPPRKRVPAKTNTPRRNAASWRGGANA